MSVEVRNIIKCDICEAYIEYHDDDDDKVYACSSCIDRLMNLYNDKGEYEG